MTLVYHGVFFDERVTPFASYAPVLIWNNTTDMRKLLWEPSGLGSGSETPIFRYFFFSSENINDSLLGIMNKLTRWAVFQPWSNFARFKENNSEFFTTFKNLFFENKGNFGRPILTNNRLTLSQLYRIGRTVLCLRELPNTKFLTSVSF